MANERFTDRLGSPDPAINESWGGQYAAAKVHLDKGDLPIIEDTIFDRVAASPPYIGAKVLAHSGLGKVQRAVDAVRDRTGL